MKRITKKLKSLKKSGKEEVVKAPRITNETVAEHREQILAGGRKFKYPIQYAKHRLIINTVIISIVAIILLIVTAWWQLYPAQNTSAFFYRLTQILPLPVGSVDGQNIPYRDYLMEYRSSIHWLEQKSKQFDIDSKDGKRQADHIKRQSLNRAIANAYASKLAESRNIKVSDKEVDEFITTTYNNSSRKLSKHAYEAVLSDSFGVSPDEYKLIVKEALLRKKVAFEIDTEAKEKITTAKYALDKGRTFDEVVVRYSDDLLTKTTKGDVGYVPRSNQDQGLVEAALKLKKGAYSDIIKGSNSYYIIKLIDSNETQVRYARITVTLHTFNQQLENLKKQGKVIEYINVRKEKSDQVT